MSARPELSNLEASGLIQVAALQPELEYLFRHALVQEAAYASLLKQDRRALHLAAAQAIIDLHPELQRRHAGVIAMHLEQAGEAERAAQHFIVAGEHALERFANRESVAFFARAGALAGDSHPDLRLQAATGGAKAGWGYQADPHLETLEQALVGADRADPLRITEAYFWIAFLRRQRGETEETSPELKHALDRGAELGRTLSDPAAAALPRALMGAFVAFLGGLRQGAREMSDALDQIEAKGDPVSMAMVSDFLAMTYSRLGEFASAERTIDRAARFAGDGDAIARVDVDIARAALQLERGDADGARAQAQECSERAESLGAFACVVAANTMSGAASLARDDASGARAPLERGSELSLVTNMAPLRTLIQGMLGSTLARLGDFPGGIAGWDAALADARKMGDRYGEAQTLWGRGRTYAKQKDWATALPDVDRAVELFDAMEARPALSRALGDRAQILEAMGRAEEARADEERSTELARELGLRDAT